MNVDAASGNSSADVSTASDVSHSQVRVRAEQVLALQSAGKFAEALAAANSALTNCSSGELAALLAAKSVVLVATGDTRDALAVATAAREAARVSGSQPAMADAGLSFALVLQTLDEHRHAIDIASDCDQIGRDCGDESLRLRAQRQLANSYSSLGRHQQAIAMLQDVIARLDESGGEPPRSLQIHYARMNLLRAESRCLEQGTGNSKERQQSFLDLYRRWHAFAEDMRARNQVRLQAIALGYACSAAGEVGDAGFALAALEASLPLQYSMGLRRSCADVECQYGIILFKLGRLPDAREALLRAISLMESGGPRPLVRAWEALSSVYEALGSLAEALHALKQARHFEQQLSDGEALVAATLVEQRALIDRLSDEWSKLASEDALTGVANRRAFDRRLAAALETANTDDRAAAQFALAFLDLDQFKLVNDQCGHGIGDAVLKRFAAILTSGRRGDDLVARIGGDEFAILFSAISEEQVGGVVQTLVDNVRRENWPAIHDALHLTVSAGVACSSELPRGERSATAVLSLSDRRLYSAKRSGRDRVVTTG